MLHGCTCRIPRHKGLGLTSIYNLTIVNLQTGVGTCTFWLPLTVIKLISLIYFKDISVCAEVPFPVVSLLAVFLQCCYCRFDVETFDAVLISLFQKTFSVKYSKCLSNGLVFCLG